MNLIKGIFNAVADPRVYFLLMVLSLVGIVWKREVIATNAFGYGALAVFGLFFVLGGLDPNFRLIITKPDNVPIVGLIFLLVFFVWYSMKQAVVNDRRIAKGEGPEEAAESDAPPHCRPPCSELSSSRAHHTDVPLRIYIILIG